MDRLVKKYADKTAAQGLANPDELVVIGLDDEFVWNRAVKDKDIFCRIFDGLNINSLMYGMPQEPYASITRYLAGHTDGAVFPKDCETRTFLHDLPIAEEFSSAAIVHHLKRRKMVIMPDGAVASFGTVSPEEAFVSFSSVSFACYVKFMSDCLADIKAGSLNNEAASLLKSVIPQIVIPPKEIPQVVKGPLETEDALVNAICEAGRITVEHRLVDSFFGNISAKQGDTIYISQTGSSLEELEGCIDPCPVDKSSSAGITASSELTAHAGIYEKTDSNVILHGHPKFCVVMTLDCDEVGCKNDGKCHLVCEKERFIEDIPIVPGEVGTGKWGLCNTVPPAMRNRRGVAVYGHGLFVPGNEDFSNAVKNTFDIERLCIEKFIQAVS